MHERQQRRQAGSQEYPGLILTPTRELAIQIGESIQAYGRYLDIRHLVIFGGGIATSAGSNPATRRRYPRGNSRTSARPDAAGIYHTGGYTLFILDEADRVVDMGFVHDVKRVLPKLPAKRQTLFSPPPCLKRFRISRGFC